MFTADKLDVLLNLKKTSMSWKDISATIGSPVETCRSAWKRYRKIEGLPKKIKTSRSIITGRIGLLIKRVVYSNPKIPYRDIPAALIALEVSVEECPSATTIQTFLKLNSIQKLPLNKKPMIHERNQLKRMIFARSNVEESENFWKSIIWSDETSFKSIPKNQNQSAYMHSKTPMRLRPINPQVQNGGFTVMFWGCFSWYGLGPLKAIDGSMRQGPYIELLKEELLPELEAAPVHMTFMQDNAPCHKALSVMRFLEAEDIPTLEWPPQSPDMNPIENLWAIIKGRRQKKFGIPTSRDQLIDQVYATWLEITPELCKTLAMSAVHRLEDCIKVNGKATMY